MNDRDSTAEKSIAAINAGERMNWKGEYVINDAGQCLWHQGLRIQDEGLKLAYRRNAIVEYMVETSAIMGVKVGMA